VLVVTAAMFSEAGTSLAVIASALVVKTGDLAETIFVEASVVTVLDVH